MQYCDECGAKLEYVGGNEWECSECDAVYEIEGLEDDDYDDEERLSVWDAAAIWRSRGKDEDYMFGYTEDELEDA